MRIDLSKEQYLKLVRLVLAGNWLVNSHRTGEEIIEEYEKIEQHILSFYRRYDAEDTITFDEEYSRYYPTKELEAEIMELSDDYDEKNFWDGLVSRMAKKEAMKKYSDPTVEQIWNLEDKYSDEFEENGLKRLKIDWKE